MQYFITYNLGIPSPTGKKANLGTIVHKTLEVLAQCKKRLQMGEKPGMRIDDGELGTIKFTKKRLLSNKFVCDILDMCYDYYVKGDSHNEYDYETDYDFCRQMVDNCLNINDGQFDPRKMKIVAPEKDFIINIDEPWAEFEYNGQSMKLAIKGTMDLITELSPDTLEYVDYKGLPVDTAIPTLTGWSTMGELKIGDIIFDKDGNQTKVIGKSEKKIKPCYKITFDDMTTAICDNEHLWTLEDGTVVNILDLKHKDKISVAKPLRTDSVDLPIDPYVLGLWLGDGRNSNGEISKKDAFIYEEIERRGYSVGDDINKSGACPSRTVYGLRTQLRSLNLLHNKHIPQIYLRASFEQRLDLLRGLMDSDGSPNPARKQAVFTNCDKRLSDDVKSLLLTLGQRPNQASTQQTGFGLTVNAYPVSFRPVNINPFLLPRKAEKIDLEWGPGESNRRLIVSIEPVEEMETQCIMVDSPSSTYLCTENLIPTHNTGRRIDWATGQEKTYEKLHSDPQLLLYYYAMSKLYPQYDSIVMTIFFLRDGGPFSLCFEKKDNDKFLDMLKDRFFEIRNSTNPRPINQSRSDFRCRKLCHYYKTNWPGTNTRMCNHVEDQIKLYGIDVAQETLKTPGHTLGYYKAPGSIE